MKNYTGMLKVILEVGDILSKHPITDDLIHGIRYHIRHSLKIDFPRDKREVIESILWWENRFIDIYKKDKLNDKDKKELKRCYFVIDKRINELKAFDRKLNKTNTKLYNQLYDELNKMKEKIENRGIKLIA